MIGPCDNGLYQYVLKSPLMGSVYFAPYPDLTIRPVFRMILKNGIVTIDSKSREFKKVIAHDARGLRRQMLGIMARIDLARTVWDWAFVYCFEQLTGRNDAERNQMGALISREFIRLTKHIQITEWEGMSYEQIELFDNKSCNELARNAQWYAARYQVITVPHVTDADFISRDGRGALSEDIF